MNTWKRLVMTNLSLLSVPVKNSFLTQRCSVHPAREMGYTWSCGPRLFSFIYYKQARRAYAKCQSKWDKNGGLHTSQVAHQARAYPDFCSMKQLGVVERTNHEPTAPTLSHSNTSENCSHIQHFHTKLPCMPRYPFPHISLTKNNTQPVCINM